MPSSPRKQAPGGAVGPKVPPLVVSVASGTCTVPVKRKFFTSRAGKDDAKKPKPQFTMSFGPNNNKKGFNGSKPKTQTIKTAVKKTTLAPIVSQPPATKSNKISISSSLSSQSSQPPKPAKIEEKPVKQVSPRPKVPSPIPPAVLTTSNAASSQSPTRNLRSYGKVEPEDKPSVIVSEKPAPKQPDHQPPSPRHNTRYRTRHNSTADIDLPEEAPVISAPSSRKPSSPRKVPELVQPPSPTRAGIEVQKTSTANRYRD